FTHHTRGRPTGGRAKGGVQIVYGFVTRTRGRTVCRHCTHGRVRRPIASARRPLRASPPSGAELRNASGSNGVHQGVGRTTVRIDVARSAAASEPSRGTVTSG